MKRIVLPKSDIAIRLAEWIELISILGADKIFLYVVEIMPKVQKVRFYTKTHFSPLFFISLI